MMATRRILTTCRAASLAPARNLATASARPAGRSLLLATGSSVAAVGLGLGVTLQASEEPVDVPAVKKAVSKLLEDDEDMGPTLIRLAWHASGTYDKHTGTGGSNGATMRFAPESNHGANAGLTKARNFLEPVKAAFPSMSYADLWILGSYAALESMGGPEIPFLVGRTDAPSGASCPPEGRLPNGQDGEGPDTQDCIDKTAAHVRWVFDKMGFNDKEMVALIGAHALGRCHTDASGYEGPWTNAPTTFSSEYFRLMLEDEWQLRKWNGPEQYENVKSGKNLMMLPADLVLVRDPEFKKACVAYLDYDVFAKDFAAAYKKLTELGFAPSAPWWKFWA